MNTMDTQQTIAIETAVKNFELANVWLEMVIMHPENWYSHEQAISDAKELVFFSATEIEKAVKA